MNCSNCSLRRFTHEPVLGEGSPKAKVLIIGEAPGKGEDALGRPFIGKSGKFLRGCLSAAGYSEDDYYLTNLVCCRPTDRFGGENRSPVSEEVRNCVGHIREIVERTDPRVIILLGLLTQAWEDLILEETKTRGIHTVHLPLPASILRRGGEGAPNYQRYLWGLEEALKLSICKGGRNV